MNDVRRHVAAPFGAAGLTLLLTFAGSAQAGTAGNVLAGLAALAVPLAVPAAWGWAVLRSGRGLALVSAAAAWLVPSLLWSTPTLCAAMAGNLAAGIVIGLGLRRGWRVDAMLATAVAVLAPMFVWSLVQFPVDRQMALVEEQALGMLERDIPASATAEQRAEAVELQRQQVAKAAGMAAQVYRSTALLGLLCQAAAIFGLLRLASRLRRVAVPATGWPPFTRWRLPFYLVWVLTVGVGLVVTRRQPLTDVGANLALAAACVLSVQGVAVQAHVVNRSVGPTGRLLYWLVMGFLGFPLLVGSPVLGLIDQWWDIRRLDGVDDDTDGS